MTGSDKRIFPKSMSFRACIYPSESTTNHFTAHCLELDVIGQDETVEGAVSQLLEAIETQLLVCSENQAQFEFWAPGIVWYKYEQAKKANRKVPDELVQRIIRNANKRLGHKNPVKLDTITATKEVMDEWPAMVG